MPGGAVKPCIWRVVHQARRVRGSVGRAAMCGDVWQCAAMCSGARRCAAMCGDVRQCAAMRGEMRLCLRVCARVGVGVRAWGACLAPEEGREVLQRDPLAQLGQKVPLASEDARLVTGAFVHQWPDEAPGSAEEQRRVDDEHPLDGLHVHAYCEHAHANARVRARAHARVHAHAQAQAHAHATSNPMRFHIGISNPRQF